MRAQEAPSKQRESLLREDRLRRRTDYLRCYEQGRRRRGRLVTLFVVEREPGATGPRLGITVTRKVGNSVIRHRIKRRVKEIYRRWSQRNQLPPSDILVHLRPQAGEADFATLQKELIQLLSQLMEGNRRDQRAER